MIALLSSFYDIVFLLIIIFIFVCWILLQILINFSKKDAAISYGLFYTKCNHLFLEFIWTIIPIFVFFLIFIPVFKLVRVINTSSDLSMKNLDINDIYYCDVLPTVGTTIKVIGNQWYWLYEYDDLLFTVNNLVIDTDEFIYSYMLDLEYDNNNSNFLISRFSEDYSLRLLSTDYSIILTKNTPVRFVITSYDVIHSWSLPSAGIKVDASPGRITSIKSIFKLNGYYYGQCSELCGFLHGFMPISIKIF